ncbi:MAG: hypothetical protein PHD48_05510 [Alphaproteobacteria bacterium]|nr:hypothetical protein [Alphaproteobacteria bacterium]
MHPLRVYVADDLDNIFDVSGVRKLEAFFEKTIKPLAEADVGPDHVVGIRERFYSERKLFDLPIKCLINEEKIVQAEGEISGNRSYLSQIPQRQWPYIPAHDAGDFTFGLCSAYTEALRAATGLPAFAMSATRYLPQCGGNLGYIHSFILHPDGEAEDVWGKGPIQHIAKRFHVLEYALNEELHTLVVQEINKNSPEPYAIAYERAKNLIEQHRGKKPNK